MDDMTETPPDVGDDARTKWLLIAGAVVIVAALLGALLFIDSEDDEQADDSVSSSEVTDTTPVDVSASSVERSEPPATTERPSTTTVVESTEPAATTESSLPDATSTAIWPWADGPTRYPDPVSAAAGFAVEFLGFDAPLVGEFLAGDSRSGEVEIRTFESGPVTTVLLRQLTDDDSWWVLGAASENITIDQPEAGAEIVSPVLVSGTAVAFEGTVGVELRADGSNEPVFVGFATGGALEPAPFSELFEFTSPGPTGGALVVLSSSSEDGSVLEASALRVVYR
jgi:hypothetical protein